MRLVELYRSISQLHENPGLLTFSATPLGQLGVWLLASALLWQSSLLQAVPLFLAAALIWPERVKQILGLGSLWYLLDMLQSHGITEWSVLGGGMAAIFLLLYGVYHAGRHCSARTSTKTSNHHPAPDRGGRSADRATPERTLPQHLADGAAVCGSAAIFCLAHRLSDALGTTPS